MQIFLVELHDRLSILERAFELDHLQPLDFDGLLQSRSHELDNILLSLFHAWTDSDWLSLGQQVHGYVWNDRVAVHRHFGFDDKWFHLLYPVHTCLCLLKQPANIVDRKLVSVERERQDLLDNLVKLVGTIRRLAPQDLEVLKEFPRVHLTQVKLTLQLIHVLRAKYFCSLQLCLLQGLLVVQVEVFEPLPKYRLTYDHAFDNHLLEHLEDGLQRFYFD